MSDIPENLKNIERRIAFASRDAGRDPAAIKLIAVSKGASGADIRAVLAAGQKAFGENRVQEAKAKFAGLRAAGCPDLEMHLIGPLQTNKAEEAVRLFDVIETLDRPKLATALAAAIKKTGRAPALYIEVNNGGEPQKTGIAPDQLGSFLRICRQECGLRIAGLMCIPPRNEDPAPHFGRMRELATHHHIPHLSMGMSADFELAIKHGATEVRIGTAIFGKRSRD